MKRDLYIDFAKGLATLSIIFIHTAFWSGQFYIPSEFRVLSLLIDVPIFFALSGITSSGNIEKTLYRLLKLQITYMIFVTGLFFADWIFKVGVITFWDTDTLKSFYSTFGGKYIPQNPSAAIDWAQLGNWYLHSYTNCDTFPVVMGSFWYLKVYYIVTILGVLILRFFKQHISWFIALCVALTLIFNIDPNNYPSGQVGYVVYYLGVFLIGFQLKGKTIKKAYIPVLYVLATISIITIGYIYGPDIYYKINKQKFPPQVPYIVWSLLSLITVFVLYNRLKITKDTFINNIGRNAIFFYFAQGISSSLVYFIVVPLKGNIHWAVLMVLIYVINVILAILIAEVLKKADALGWKILEKLRKLTARRV
ncbi:acyltransferase family protein [Elizabethkingia ursingii]|uniref:Acyltransferase n=1 Tax=Elizabethkingia ursingii TaxID=1756150 RepID=A0AAJ3TPJ6_9FLAO|nr:acyltransferase family protein [Elizabethkingia ursingii]AQX08888.1 acyltransferase [Elizabethkingia ursingii]OPB77646.1 acyltransferase [Elizabethkingia ursingii]